MKKYDDKLEKILTAIFGVLGAVAIFLKIFITGFSAENILDGIKDLAGLVVVVTVFLIANKLFRKDKPKDFTEIFEQKLNEWIKQNEYLISDIVEDGKGKYNKRYCYMVKDHSNIVTRNKTANDAVINKEKGAFVYLPYLDDNGKVKNEFEFRFNESTFRRQDAFQKENGEVNLGNILVQITRCINESPFKNIPIHAKTNESNKTITVSFDNMEQTDENAKKLVEMVEYVKTMVLALA